MRIRVCYIEYMVITLLMLMLFYNVYINRVHNSDNQWNTPFSTSVLEPFSTSSNSSNSSLDSQSTIFISIPSYRDKDCKNTLRNIFHKAKYPQRLYVGVFTQNSNESTEICDVTSVNINIDNNTTSNSKHEHMYTVRQDQIRSIGLDYKDAKGPLYARTRIVNELYNNETYFLMIDAHTDLDLHWDIRLIHMLEYLKHTHGVKKPILSSYSDHQENMYEHSNNDKTTNLICDIKKGNSYPIMVGAIKKPEGYFYKTLLMSGNGTFTYGSFYREIKMDPTLQFVFNGEEFYFSVLAYTNGWDVYSFPYSHIFHIYRTDEKKKKEGLTWYDDTKGIRSMDKERESHMLLRRLLTDERFATTHVYGIGIQRSLKNLYQELGYDSNAKDFKDRWSTKSKNRLCNDMPKLTYPKPDLTQTYSL